MTGILMQSLSSNDSVGKLYERKMKIILLGKAGAGKNTLAKKLETR
jgi:guanylate kinase